ncbi:ATP-dependent sacrificial sulfur transferase LarE [Desulfatiferula olefinivorans]
MKNNHLSGKLDRLTSILAEGGPLTVAFSGGVDSTFLLSVAATLPGIRAQAIIAKTPLLSGVEEQEALSFVNDRQIPFHVVSPDVMAVRGFVENGKDRCYACKRCLFSAIIERAAETGRPRVVHGANRDDARDYRPGMKAASELGVESPLAEAGFFKTDIREASRRLGLPSADKPAMACLATRIPYGEAVTVEKLRTVEQAETVLRNAGFVGARARHHGPQVRIEILSEDFGRMLSTGVRTRLAGELRALGFTYVSLDLDGYAQGSMNRLIDV